MSDAFFIRKSREFDLLVSNLSDIVIVTHYNPDGDTVGSALALSNFLRSLKKRTQVISPNFIPDNLSFIYNCEEVLIFEKDTAKSKEAIYGTDLIVFIDQSSISRTEVMSDLLRSTDKKKIVIDHHPDTDWDDFFWGVTTTEVSSTCELLYYLIKNSGYIGGDVSKIPLPCAAAMYVGMITDTNNFSNSLYPSTLTMASELLARGVDRELINRSLYQSFSEERMRFMGFALYDKMVVKKSIKSAYIVLTAEDMERFNFITGDTEGFVNLPLAIDGVEVSALFTEKNGHIRVSLRSAGELSVNDLSGRYFNGGGHAKAAGGKLFIPVSEVGEYFEKSMDSYIKGTSFVKEKENE